MGRNVMHIKFSVLPILGAMGVTLAGCAGSADKYPSLAIRDFERAPATAPGDGDDGGAGSPALSQSDIQNLENLVAKAREAHQRFLRSAPQTQRLVSAAAGGGVTDNRWASAQVALANLESLRSEAAIPLGDIDRIYAESAIDLAMPDQVALARQDIVALIAEEDRLLASLRGRIRQ